MADAAAAGRDGTDGNVKDVTRAVVTDANGDAIVAGDGDTDEDDKDLRDTGSLRTRRSVGAAAVAVFAAAVMAASATLDFLCTGSTPAQAPVAMSCSSRANCAAGSNRGGATTGFRAPRAPAPTTCCAAWVTT